MCRGCDGIHDFALVVAPTPYCSYEAIIELAIQETHILLMWLNRALSFSSSELSCTFSSFAWSGKALDVPEVTEIMMRA